MELQKFPRDEDLFELFSCSICERKNSGAKIVFKGVVMDGTVLRILGALPNFSRHTKVVKPVKGVPEKQYIVREPKSRSFIDSALFNARGNGEKALLRSFEILFATCRRDSFSIIFIS